MFFLEAPQFPHRVFWHLESREEAGRASSKMKRQRGELSKPINAYLCKFVRSKQNESENKTWTSCIDLFWISLVNINFKRILLVARHAVRHEIAGKNWRSLIDLYDICSIHFSVITNLFNDDCTEKVTRTTFHVEHHVVAQLPWTLTLRISMHNNTCRINI